MKQFLTLLFASILATSNTCFAQIKIFGKELFGGETIKASTNYVTKKMMVDEFKQISVAGAFDVSYKQSIGKPVVEIYTSDNIVELLDIHVTGSTLYIQFKKNIKASYNKLEIRVSSEHLNNISVAGSGDVEILNKLKTSHLNLSVAGSGEIIGKEIASEGDIKCNISGSGEIELKEVSCQSLTTSVAGSGDLEIENIDTQHTKVSISGSGEINLQGKTENVNYKIAGSGEIYASRLQAEEVNASIAGSGEIECHANKSLNASIAGSGEIGYKGNPQINKAPKKGLYKL
ncbi:MAG: DUF2807 domain-containing protein [Mediterranea massiliensis]|nr:DUF2807 domain-containing protein [Mediterranea massiliensis]